MFTEDPERLLLMAKLIKSDFDFSELVEKETTEKTKEVKSELRRASRKPVRKTKKTKRVKNVWEHF